MVPNSEACPMDKPVAVMKGSEVMGCHASEADAQQQMAALDAVEPPMRSRPAAFDQAIPVALDYELRGAPNDGGMPRFYGYAAVFNAESQPLPYIETILPGAFTRSLANDSGRQTFVIDHDETKLLSSRQAKTLQITEDSRGLPMESDLPPTSYARDLVALHERGEARSMSFTFRPAKGGAALSDAGRRRTLTEVRLGHVTVLTGLEPAYRQTTASIRSLANRLGAEAEDLEETLDAIRDGKPLNTRAVELLDAIVADLREQPAETPIVAEVRGASLSVARARLALMSKAR
jgi:hypothetical protein